MRRKQFDLGKKTSAARKSVPAYEREGGREGEIAGGKERERGSVEGVGASQWQLPSSDHGHTQRTGRRDGESGDGGEGGSHRHGGER